MVGLNIVAMDIVELSPAYDTNGEISAIAAADMGESRAINTLCPIADMTVFDFLSILGLGVGKNVALPVRDEL